MKRSIAIGSLIAMYGLILLTAGCASYYKVTDPLSGREYYTEKVESDRSGAVKLKDARTDSIVTLQNSEVKEISKDEYKAGLAAPVSKPAPAVSPAPEAAPAPGEPLAPSGETK